jgi:flagellar hook assembly protein FlgD
MKATRTMVLVAALVATGITQAAALELKQNCPNPFNTQTCVSFAVAAPQRASLKVYDLKGSIVRTLFDGVVASTDHREVVWDGRDENGHQAPAGVYIYRLEAGTFSGTKRMTLLK